MNRDSASGFGIGILVGVAAGLIVGFLYAPRSGRETREIISGRAREISEQAKERWNRLRGKAREAEEEVSERASS